MTTYYEYSSMGGNAEPEPTTTVSGYRCSFDWVDPTVSGILNMSDGKAAALDYANTQGPPNPGWILAKITVGSPLYESMTQIGPA